MAEKHIPVKIKSYFSAFANRQNLESGEEIQTSLSKVKKWFSDLGTAAFTNSTDYAAVSHNQAANTITAMTGYTKPSSTSAITASDTLNQAIGKLEKGLEDAGGSGGDLAAHIATHVEDTNGIHGIRCKDGALEVWNEYTQTWCDPSEIGWSIGNVSNLAITQGDLSLTITWTDPANTVDATWAGTRLVMGAGTYPESITDGTLLVNSTVRDAYSSTGYTVSNLTDGTTYYFKLFPYTDKGVITNDNANQISASARELNSWDMLQAKVRTNDMGDISIGDQYTCSQGSGELTWDVIGKNIDTPANSNLSHALTLRVHSVLLNNLVFDEKDAFYACQTEALSAGTYNYTSDGKTYQFTLTQQVPVGGQLVCTDDITLESYASGISTTPIETVGVTTGDSGTNLGTLDSNSSSGNLNADNKRKSGSNDWRTSTIRQWLNSNKPAGQWWEPKTSWDRPPAYAETMNGFMYDLDPEFLGVIGKTRVITKYYYNTALTYRTEDYFFLMSGSQVNSSYSGEGTKYTPYSDNASRIMYKNGSAISYWLRSPISSSSNRMLFVNSDGDMYTQGAARKNGVVLACNLI